MDSFAGVVKEMPGVKHLRKARYARFFRKAENLNLFHGIFDDFKAAELSAPRNKVLGYDHEKPAALYDEYFENIGPSDFAALFWLERLGSQIKSVYDFGGHVGIKYYAYSRYMSSEGNIAWTTYDLPAIVARGRQIAQERKIGSLQFSDNVKDLEKGYDLFFASGSFQYLENPIDFVFKNLKQKPRYVLINMIPTHESQSYITLQNIGPAFCPYKIFKADEFIAQLCGYDYQLIDKWKNPEKTCVIPFNESFNVIGYSGFLFRLS